MAKPLSPDPSTTLPSPQHRPVSVSAALFLLGLCLIWGANMVAIKISNRGFPPLLSAGMRSTGAAALLVLLSTVRRESVWPRRRLLPHALAVGGLFAGEFLFLYQGTTLTSASRGTVLLYTAPFWTTLGAHFLLRGDRIGGTRAAGLALSFAGLLAVFAARGEGLGDGYWVGDLMQVVAALFWAFTTLYAKRLLDRHRITSLQVLFFQLAFSAPILLAASGIFEAGRTELVWRLDSALSLLHQTFVVAFLSYLGWFWLIQRHRVSTLSAFSFFTPLFGVLFGGLWLHEPLPPLLWIGLALVAAGIYLVNRRPQVQPTGSAP